MSAAAKSLRVLILGGTGFIGPHFISVLNDAGHRLTLFNRGRRQARGIAGVETLTGDRNGQVDALRGREWDVVIDNSGYTPRQVRLTTDLLNGHVQHYIFISSISAYADFAKPGIDEDYPVAQLADPNAEEITGATYGGLKARCEQIVEQTYGANCAVIRPTYIVGPGDTTDRFTYWPVRVAQGGAMLAPGTASDPIQFIDVRDLADFIQLCVEQRIGGRYNACTPPRAVTIGALLNTSKQVSRSNAQFVWADASFLQEQKLLDAGEIPIWAPPQGDSAGIALVSSTRAEQKGLKFRTLDTTVRDTLAWHERPHSKRDRRFAPV